MITDYYYVLLRAIETTKNDPVQLRSVIYELARISLRNQVLMRYHLLGGGDGLRQHMAELETAINSVEALSLADARLLAPPSEGQASETPIKSSETTAIVPRGEPYDFQEQPLETPDRFYEDDVRWRDDVGLVRRQAPTEIYAAHSMPVLSESAQITYERLGKRIWIAAWPTVQLVMAAILGVAIYVTAIGRPDYTTAPNPSLGVQTFTPKGKPQIDPANATTEKDLSEKRDARATELVLGFPLPSVYGVYGVSDGKLTELESFPIKVPDQRVAISAMISKPSATTFPNGRLAFVVFRRDLVMNAPEKATTRVVARVVREMKFTGAGGAPKISKIDDIWAVRSNSYEFRVAPLGQNPEMVMIRPEDSDFALPAGRYALVLKGAAYDFSVAGPITDTAQCLERTEALNGTVYSECRTP
jgi:hypothetical protein